MPQPGVQSIRGSFFGWTLGRNRPATWLENGRRPSEPMRLRLECLGPAGGLGLWGRRVSGFGGFGVQTVKSLWALGLGLGVLSFRSLALRFWA